MTKKQHHHDPAFHLEDEPKPVPRGGDGEEEVKEPVADDEVGEPPADTERQPPPPQPTKPPAPPPHATDDPFD